MANQLLTQKHIINFILVVILAFSVTPGFANQSEQPKIDKEAPLFTLESLQGKRVSLADYRGTFVIIHFATSW